MTPSFIAGDWGTSRLRLYLCAGDEVLDRRTGPGAVGQKEPHQATLSALIAPWVAAHGPLPVLLCGMVGSRNGWVEAPYAPCPADALSLAALRVRFTADETDISIVPGVVAKSDHDAPDVMRGEETQLIGALALRPELSQGRHLLALPGTHTKWATIEDGRITHFKTALTGELFALLRDHSTLVKVGGDEGLSAGEGFTRGLERYAAAPGDLLHQLFEVRSRQLIDGWGAGFALDFLSGLLIAADVERGARMTAADAPITLIGDPLLTDRYAQALSGRGGRVHSLSGEACALAGLRAIVQPCSDTLTTKNSH
jgi:2-dehydro-3-deoxygalactonokinase